LESESLRRGDYLKDQGVGGRYPKTPPSCTDHNDVRIRALVLTQDFLHRNSDWGDSTFHL
jgi:hypothetical protein